LFLLLCFASSYWWTSRAFLLFFICHPFLFTGFFLFVRFWNLKNNSFPAIFYSRALHLLMFC
jgi:hypothetical protein